MWEKWRDVGSLGKLKKQLRLENLLSLVETCDARRRIYPQVLVCLEEKSNFQWYVPIRSNSISQHRRGALFTLPAGHSAVNAAWNDSNTLHWLFCHDTVVHSRGSMASEKACPQRKIDMRFRGQVAAHCRLACTCTEAEHLRYRCLRSIKRTSTCEQQTCIMHQIIVYVGQES